VITLNPFTLNVNLLILIVFISFLKGDNSVFLKQEFKTPKNKNRKREKLCLITEYLLPLFALLRKKMRLNAVL
jgi:hypothetical protein